VAGARARQSLFLDAGRAVEVAARARHWTRAMRKLVMIVAAATVALSGSLETVQAGLCVKRSGQMIFRTAACKKRETQLAPDAIAAMGPKGDPGAKGPSGRYGNLRLFNGTGQPIGFFDADSEVLLKSPLEGLPVHVFGFNSTGFIDQPVILFHESENCDGPPLFADSVNPLVRLGFIRGGTVFYAGDPVTRHATILSRQQASASCLSGIITNLGFCCTNQVQSPRSAGPVQVFDAAAVFGSPPFMVGP